MIQHAKRRKGRKLKPNKSVYALRRIIGKEMTQAKFAAMIGASKDTVISWENGRNPVSDEFRTRIAMATGADISSGDGRVQPGGYLGRMLGGKPYDLEAYKLWRKTFGSTTEETAKAYTEIGADSLALVLIAAARAGSVQGRLPAVWQSYVDWLGRTCHDFKLGREIDALLKARRFNNQIPIWAPGQDMRAGKARSVRNIS